MTRSVSAASARTLLLLLALIVLPNVGRAITIETLADYGKVNATGHDGAVQQPVPSSGSFSLAVSSGGSAASLSLSTVSSDTYARLRLNGKNAVAGGYSADSTIKLSWGVDIPFEYRLSVRSQFEAAGYPLLGQFDVREYDGDLIWGHCYRDYTGCRDATFRKVLSSWNGDTMPGWSEIITGQHGDGTHTWEVLAEFWPLGTPPPKTYAVLVGSHAPSGGVPNAIRGDLDVANVAAKLSWATETNTIVYNSWNAPDTVASDIESAIKAVAGKAKPGDSLLFYYSGHGSGGCGAGVEDFINGVQGSSYQDDTLTSLLADHRLAWVRKFVLLDSCHSEGFWKNDTGADNDMETLSSICFLSAATEDGRSYADPNNGTGYFTNAILPGLNPNATFESLLALAKGAPDDTVTGYYKDDGYGTGEWEVASYYSPDFDPNTQLNGHIAPEPSTLALLTMGALTLTIGWWRRRR